jgi:hypothetical protein
MSKKLTAPCLDCQADTLKIDEFYMVSRDLWLMAVPDEDHEMTKYLCIGCLEIRIGRQLRASDFLDVPMNWPGNNVMSERYRDRLAAE